MATAIIAETVEAGNGSYETLYTVPADSTVIVNGFIGYNTSGGDLVCTAAIKRQGTDRIIAVETIGATGTNSPSGSLKVALPLTLKTGDILKVKGSGSGIEVTVSGLRIY